VLALIVIAHILDRYRECAHSTQIHPVHDTSHCPPTAFYPNRSAAIFMNTSIVFFSFSRMALARSRNSASRSSLREFPRFLPASLRASLYTAHESLGQA
jgi:hypothetical protein